jgi:hypothetical protein
MGKLARCLILLTLLALLLTQDLCAQEAPAVGGTITITLEEAAAANAAFQENKVLQEQVKKLDEEFKTLLGQHQTIVDAYDPIRAQAETVVAELLASHKREASLESWKRGLGISALAEALVIIVLVIVAVLK